MKLVTSVLRLRRAKNLKAFHQLKMPFYCTLIASITSVGNGKWLRGHVFFYDAREPKTVYECKCVDPWNTQFKNIQILYILKRPLEKVGWTAFKQRGIECNESTFLREAFEKLTAWTPEGNSESGWKKRLYQKKKFIGSLLFGICFECYMVGAKTCASWQWNKAELEIHTHRPGRPDQTDQILRNITIYTFELTPHHSPLAAISQTA